MVVVDGVQRSHRFGTEPRVVVGAERSHEEVQGNMSAGGA
jgi:hypothetical protein